MWLGLDRALRSNWSEDLDLISRTLSRDSEASLGCKGQENGSGISSRYHNFKEGHLFQATILSTCLDVLNIKSCKEHTR